MKLIVVESRSKIKNIQGYVGSEYKVISSGGHIAEIVPKPESLSVTKNGISAAYRLTKGGKSFMDNLLKLKPKTIYLATDDDREGESIAMDIVKYTGEKNIEYKRVVFNSITKEVVRSQMQSPREINYYLVESAEARRLLDFMIGFTISPVLWKMLPGAISIGRIQAPSLYLLYEREKKLIEQKPNFVWELTISYGGVKFVREWETFRAMREALKGHIPTIAPYKKWNLYRKSPDPYDTSTIQSHLGHKMGMSASSIMSILQNLYSGSHSLEKKEGLITYLRTDSTRINAVFLRNFIDDNLKRNDLDLYREENVDWDLVKHLSNKSSISIYDAHEAIRPTSSWNDDTSTSLDGKVYGMIYTRVLASTMKPSHYKARQFILSIGDEKIISKTCYEPVRITWDGLTHETISDWREDVSGLKYSISYKMHIYNRRINEGGLIKTLKSIGVGRPSTYQSIIPTLINRKYIRVSKNKIYLSDLGIILSKYLQAFYPGICSAEYTAKMEKDLDMIARGLLNKMDMLKKYHQQIMNSSNIGYETNVDSILKNDRGYKCCGKEVMLNKRKRGWKIYEIYFSCDACNAKLPYEMYYLNKSKDHKTYQYKQKVIAIKDDLESQLIDASQVDSFIRSERLKTTEHQDD